jgi:hypothetical protein
MKISTAGYVLGIIILLVGSSLASSATTLNMGNEQITKITNGDLTLQKDIDQKIMDIIEMVNESIVMGFLEELVAFGPRLTGTYGSEAAANYLYQQFEEMGLETRYHDWTAFCGHRKKRFYEDQNVEATLQGADDSCDEILIFNAHYDTVKVSPGANDDGSGVAAVLTAAQVLSQFEFNHTIKFVCFSGEEIGLLGSRAYVEELYINNEEVLVEFNADMIGYVETAEGFKTARISSTKDVAWIVDDIEMINGNYGINFDISKGTITPGGPRGGSDYYYFVQYGYESIAFWESEWNRDYFHTPEDTIEHMNISYLVKMTKLIVGSLAHLADIENAHPQVKIASPKRGKLYFEDRTIKDLKHEKTIVIDDMLIFAEVKPGNAPITKVEFYYDDKLINENTEPPYRYQLNKLSIRKHKIEVVVYDEQGRSASDEINVFYFNLNKNR